MNLWRRSMSWVGLGGGEKNSTEKSSTEQCSSQTNNVDDPETAVHTKPAEGSIGSALWSILSSKLGGDVLSNGISLPAWFYEPLSMLQRQAEMIEYSQLLTTAAKCETTLERMVNVAAFAVSGYSATQRFKTCFNPLLGETFEYTDPRNGARFLAEQVCHHPPKSALHAESQAPDAPWMFWQNSGPRTKFLGNALDLITHGHSYLHFPATGERYFYTNPATRVHNIILGSMWIEHYGKLEIREQNTKSSCVINFRKSGLFQGTQYDVSGYIETAEGEKCVKLEGKWDKQITATWLIADGKNEIGTKKLIWQFPEDNMATGKYAPFNFTKFTASLNELDDTLEDILPPTDSRIRIDRLSLDRGNTTKASKYKKMIEERQRADRAKRTTKWQPVWFEERDEETHEDGKMWVYSGNYWKIRAEKEALIKAGRNPVELLVAPQIKGLAVDFTSYQLSDSDVSEETDLSASEEQKVPENSGLSENFQTDHVSCEEKSQTTNVDGILAQN